MPVQAKFRCLNIDHSLQGTTVKLQAVIPKDDNFPGGSEENRAFWDATPAADLELQYGPDAEIPIELGSYCLLDMDVVEQGERTWKLWKVAEEHKMLTVELGLSWNREIGPRSGSLSMTIHNQDAWHHFRGLVNTRWNVVISQADAPAEGANTYP